MDSTQRIIVIEGRSNEIDNENTNVFFFQNKHVVVRAVPSIKENERTANVEQKRLEKQRETLGESGLKEKETILSNAMATNEIAPPDEMITSIPVPSTEGIKFYPVEVYTSKTGKNPPGLKIEDLPVYAEAYDLHTNFCYVSRRDNNLRGANSRMMRANRNPMRALISFFLSAKNYHEYGATKRGITAILSFVDGIVH